ncbi:MAG TPA: beta-phosphoglucomutase family hydrolase [Sporichthya sp.]|jgi:beta-phosphoglucomutase family hydrolase|nr:beta-phosphoglucomutase family hydrolase [Sporichthya sp.]
MDAATALGLPAGIRACLFDLDGVLTRTAVLHAEAWKQMFDTYLRGRAEHTGEEFREFDAGADYNSFVDGKPRLEGTRDFLRSRNIELPVGDPADVAGTETLWGLSNRKNEIVRNLILDRGVEVYEGSVAYVQKAREAGLTCVVVTSSANAADVLAVAGLTDSFDARIDGVVAAERHLAGKPAPDTFLAGAEAAGILPRQAAVFEDALAGVEAGRAGGFGCVIGVDRVGQRAALKEHGADLVVSDLAELVG